MDRFSSLVALLAERARSQADQRAYAFLGDRGTEEAALTYGELHRAAQALAVRLAGLAQRGDHAVLVFPPGLEFMVAFFGCLIAGIIAVPMTMPRRNSARDSSAAILANCEPVIALTTSAFALRSDLKSRFEREGLQWLAVDLGTDGPQDAGMPLPGAQDLAFLQYTSGSTSDPKGVAVSRANLLANLEMIRLSLGNTSRSTYVNWVPLYHDMGLILNALQAFYVGAPCVLMAPNGFMPRPLNWLRAIRTYKAEVACSPNFGSSTGSAKWQKLAISIRPDHRYLCGNTENHYVRAPGFQGRRSRQHSRHHPRGAPCQPGHGNRGRSDRNAAAALPR